MVSLQRTVRNFWRVGFREWFRQLQHIGDAKSGRLIGSDQFGNRYFENLNPEEEIPGRHRWVDYTQHDYNATQVPPEWHAWLHHTRLAPPHEDPVMQAVIPAWRGAARETLTGTRGAYRPYNTAQPKVIGWQPTIRPRA